MIGGDSMHQQHQTCSRRHFLKGLAGLSAIATLTPVLPTSFTRSAKADVPKRVVIADGALAETALAMGIVPLAMADVPGYRAWVQEPKVPEQVINLGARFQPSLERLAQLDPDLILTSSFYANQYSRLSDLAPIEKIDIYSSSKTPFLNAMAAAQKIAEVTGHRGTAKILISDTLSRIDQASRELTSSRASSVLVTSMLSPRHMRVYGQNSLMQDVIDRLPVKNAWTGPTNHWGFATVTIDQIAQYSNAALIAIKPVPDNVDRAIVHSPILSELPSIKRFGLITMPPVATFGGLFAAGRFSDLLANAMTSQGAAHGEFAS